MKRFAVILMLSALAGCDDPETADVSLTPAPPALIEIAKTTTQGRHNPDWPWVVVDGQDWLARDPSAADAPSPFKITPDSWIVFQKLPPTTAGGGANVVISKQDHAVLGVFFTQ